MGSSENYISLDDSARAKLARHADWWNRRGMLFAKVGGAPLGELWLPLADGSLATEDVDLTPDMLDVERLVGPPEKPGPLEFVDDLVRTRSAYARVPWVEAILGCPIRATIQGGSMRTQSFVACWDEWESQASHRDNEWFDLLKRITEMLVARSGGRYAVGQTLMRGPSDLAEAVLGPDLMCLSMYDHPEALRRFTEEVTATFIEVLRAQLALYPSIEGGYVNSFGVWAPGTPVRTQCDSSAFLSPEQYAEWFLPYDVRICEAVDYATIHLHSYSMHTVDALVEVEALKVIQVTLDPPPSGPPLEVLLPVFDKILAHKCLIVSGILSEDEARRLQRELPTDGLCISARQADW